MSAGSAGRRSTLTMPAPMSIRGGSATASPRSSNCGLSGSGHASVPSGENFTSRIIARVVGLFKNSHR
jgi:hypothetical protein